jgi:hypothetical protein
MAQATTQQPPNSASEQAPLEAFRFATDFLPGKAEPDGTVPFTALARTGNAIAHWYWGSCVHDFAGMSSASVIPVDYGHQDDEALGLINKSAVVPDGLQLSGLLTPFAPDDKATEVIFKSGKGVPYQASIFFDPYSLVVEDVPVGFTTEVNGKTFSGPVTVFRQWELRGLALCLYGVDGGTSVGFSQNLCGKTVAVSRFKKGDDSMTTKSATKASEVKPEEPAEKKPAEEKPAEKKPVEGSTAEEETESPDEEIVEDEDPPKKPAAGTKMSRKEEGQQFITAFGEQHGPTLFAKGLTLAEAHGEFSKIMKTENDALRADIAKFKSQDHSGTSPVSFGGASAPEKEGKFGGLSGGAAKFASGLKLPTK